MATKKTGDEDGAGGDGGPGGPGGFGGAGGAGGRGRRSRTTGELTSAAAKVLGVIAVSLVPAIAALIEARAAKERAAIAITAVSKEAATNDLGFAQQADRVTALEAENRKLALEAATARALAMEVADRAPKPARPSEVKVSTSALSVAQAEAAIKFAPPAPPSVRPDPPANLVRAVEAKIKATVLE